MSDPKRFNLTMPMETFEELEAISQTDGRTVVDVIRRFISLGMLIREIQARGAEVLIREEGKEDKLIVIL